MKFDWSWDSFEFNKELLQNLIYMESLYFHPEEEISETSTLAPLTSSTNQLNASP